jgi:hypothetical protein
LRFGAVVAVVLPSQARAAASSIEEEGVPVTVLIPSPPPLDQKVPATAVSAMVTVFEVNPADV